MGRTSEIKITLYSDSINELNDRVATARNEEASINAVVFQEVGGRWSATWREQPEYRQQTIKSAWFQARRGKDVVGAVLNPGLVKRIRELHSEGLGPRKIATKLGIGESACAGVVYHRTWRHVA